VTRAPRVAFFAFLSAWCLLFAYLATIEPISHDGWWPALDHSHRGDSIAGFFDFIRYSYLNANPRLGQWLVFLAFTSTAILAAAFAGGLVVGVFVLAYARLPRPRELADTARVVAIAGLVFACVPNPGQMLCYRPFTGNYVWAACVTIALVAPYRIAIDRSIEPNAILMFVLGLAAGMCNEHTGPTAIAFVAWATYRVRDRWTIAGLLGLVAGFALLIGAPGQSERYHGLGADMSIVGNLLDRGLAGNARIVGMAFLYTIGSWALLAVASIKKRAVRRDAAIFAAAAIAIVLTVLLSPKWGARLFVAPALLLIAAGVRAIDEAFVCRYMRGALAAIGALCAIGGSVVLASVQRDAGDDFDARVALLREAAPGTVASVPPYRHFTPGWWTYGDDFRAAPVRQHVARRVFGLDDATLDTHDPHVIRNAGVSLELVVDPPAPDAVRAADAAADGYSDQLFTPDGARAAIDRFHAAVAAIRARAPIHRAALRTRGLAPAVDVAAWDETGGFTVIGSTFTAICDSSSCHVAAGNR